MHDVAGRMWRAQEESYPLSREGDVAGQEVPRNARHRQESGRGPRGLDMAGFDPACVPGVSQSFALLALVAQRESAASAA